MRPWRVVRRLLVGLSLVAIGLAVYTWRHWSAAAPGYPVDTGSIELPLPLRTSAEHDAARERNGGEPYVLEISADGPGAILYFGVSHSRAPDHPQIADIEARWRAFGPSVALCEGRARGYFYGALIEPFAGLSEFAAEHVALYFFLRVYASEAGGVPNERLAADLLTKRTDVRGLRGSLTSIASVDRVWERDVSATTDWRTLPVEPRSGILGQISEASRRIRGEHMIRTLTDLARKGERVFAVVGSGHVIRQEWNLRALFSMAPAWDQPLR